MNNSILEVVRLLTEMNSKLDRLEARLDSIESELGERHRVSSDVLIQLTLGK
jgi:hypothetical protein